MCVWLTLFNNPEVLHFYVTDEVNQSEVLFKSSANEYPMFPKPRSDSKIYVVLINILFKLYLNLEYKKSDWWSALLKFQCED